jgi:hypothetical protein
VAELDQVCARLRPGGNIDASGIELRVEDVERLREAVPRVNERPYFEQPVFAGASFLDGVNFRGASFAHSD